MTIPVALQLYTVRDELEKDFLGTLEKVSQAGYRAVEFYSGFFGGLSAEELRRELDRLGLKTVGSHVSLQMLREQLEEVTDYLLKLDAEYIALAWSKFETRQEWLDLAAFLNDAGRRCAEKGLTLCYHNHNHEFIEYDGQYALDLILTNSDPANVKLELDTYWAQYAYVDPVEYTKKLNGRVVLLHQKDMRASDRKFCEVGEGIMDIKAIHKAGEQFGAKWFIVEQDACEGPSLVSIKTSLDNLKKMGLD